MVKTTMPHRIIQTTFLILVHEAVTSLNCPAGVLFFQQLASFSAAGGGNPWRFTALQCLRAT